MGEEILRIKNMNNVLQSISIDCVIFGFEETDLKVLLIKRSLEPEVGKWSLPGGFVMEKEALDNAAERVLTELTGVKEIFLDQVKAFGSVNRFPLHRVITIGYYALIKPEFYQLKPGAHASEAKWFSVKEVSDLPFDHFSILKTALLCLQQKVRYEPIGFELLPEKFSLTELQQLYEAILSTQLDKRNFRKKLLKMNLLKPLNETQKNVAHRAARLYKFDQNTYKKLMKKGFIFEL